MKPFSFSRIMPFASFFMALCAIMFMAAIHPPPSWQPPITDDSMRGDGTHEDPQGVVIPIVFAATITQATTAAPTSLELANLIDASAFTYTRDSIGSYKIEGSDAAFQDSTLIYMATIRNAPIGGTGSITPHFYRINDSLSYLKILDPGGRGHDLAGKCDILLIDPNPEE